MVLSFQAAFVSIFRSNIQPSFFRGYRRVSTRVTPNDCDRVRTPISYQQPLAL